MASTQVKSKENSSVTTIRRSSAPDQLSFTGVLAFNDKETSLATT